MIQQLLPSSSLLHQWARRTWWFVRILPSRVALEFPSQNHVDLQMAGPAPPASQTAPSLCSSTCGLPKASHGQVGFGFPLVLIYLKFHKPRAARATRLVHSCGQSSSAIFAFFVLQQLSAVFCVSHQLFVFSDCASRSLGARHPSFANSSDGARAVSLSRDGSLGFSH